MIKTNLINLINEENNKKLNQMKNESKEQEKFNKSEQISELRMHKILYFIYGYFYKEFEKEIFSANFEAWKYGPVEIDYRCYGSCAKKYNVNLNESEISFLKRLIAKLLNYSIFSLVEESHFTKPWKENFIANKKNQKIPNSEIQEFYKNQIWKNH